MITGERRNSWKVIGIILLSLLMLSTGFVPAGASVPLEAAPGEFGAQLAGANFRFPKVYSDDELALPRVIWVSSSNGNYYLKYNDGQATVTEPFPAINSTMDALHLIDSSWIAWSVNDGSKNKVNLWHYSAGEGPVELSQGGIKVAMEDGNVAWKDRTSGDCLMFYHQVDGVYRTDIIPYERASRVAVTGNMVVFLVDSTLYVSNGVNTSIIDTISNDFAVDNGKVIYDKTKDSYTNSIYLWDVATGVKQLISDSGYWKKNLRLDGNQAVWIDTAFGILDLYFYDGDVIKKITAPDSLPTLGDNSHVDLQDGLLVWEVSRNGYLQVMLYDTEREAMYQVTGDTPGGCQNPVVDNGWIAWWTTAGIGLFHYTPEPLPEPVQGDFNRNMVIDVEDLTLLAGNYGLVDGENGFDELHAPFDLVADRVIDLYDLVWLARRILLL